MQTDIYVTPINLRWQEVPRTPSPRHPLADLDTLAEILDYDRDERICIASPRSPYWFRLVSGAARICIHRSDGGRRQNLDVLVPGDLFGFGLHPDHRYAVEAIAEVTTVARYPRWGVEFLAETDAAIAATLRAMALGTISRIQLQLLCSASTACGKICSILLDLADRATPDAHSWFDLPLGRRDLAKYLGLSVETLGRTLASLKRRSLIDLTGARRVRILDPEALLVFQLAEKRSIEKILAHS
jgi:CRP/FNR family nitrogen fixation transcriptional regulator